MYNLTVLTNKTKEKIQFEISCDEDEDTIEDPQHLQIAAFNANDVPRFSVVNYERLSSNSFILGRVSVKRSKGGASLRILATFDLKANPQGENILNGEFSLVLLKGALTPFSALNALAVFDLHEEALSHDRPIRETSDHFFEPLTDSDLLDDSVIVLPKKRKAIKHFIQNTRQSLDIESQHPLSYGYLFEEADVLLPRKVYS